VTIPLDETHDPRIASWVPSAADSAGDFPLQNLPLGVFRRRGGGPSAPRIGVAIGTDILDLAGSAEAGALGSLDPAVRGALAAPVLNGLMALGRPAARILRERVHALLRADSRLPRPPAGCLVPMAEAELLLPAAVGDYSDFYASVHHATNVGKMFRPDQPLLPNYKWVPIGYHGRASSVVPSGTPIRRPAGQTRAEGAAVPAVGPSRSLDYELEVAAWVGLSNRLGAPIPMAEAESHLFGLSLLNDWSARDIQRWEYQPLGPFLAKSFGTTVSPWVVTLEALAPFRIPAALRPPDDPAPLPYLFDPGDGARGGFAITLEVFLSTAKMRAGGVPPARISRGSFGEMYWTMAQLLTHHASNGCNLRPGDLLGSGTVSGPSPESRGCLLELSRGGAQPIQLPGGESRRFLEDGDEVVLRGRCERDGARGIGFGECRGVIVP
jgi:fumarylacetoacetase